MRKGILKKSCAWLLTLVTVLSTVFTSTTGLFADETDTSATEVVSQDTTETTATEEPTVGETSKVAEPTVQGSIYVKLNEGGIVIVTYGDNKQTIQKSDGKVTATDNNNVTTDITSSLVNGYYLVATEDVDSVVTTEVKSQSGYSVETYRILSDAGEVVENVEDFATLSSNYRREVSVTQTSRYIEVGFKADEVVEESEDEIIKETTTTEETTDAEQEQSVEEDVEDWRVAAMADPNWLCKSGDLLTPEEMEEYTQPEDSFGMYSIRLYAAAGTSGSVTSYSKITNGTSTCGSFILI